MLALRSSFKEYENECARKNTGPKKSVPFLSHELADKLGELVRSERKITNEILKLINQAFDQRTYLDLGYPSMFEWLTKGFGYSNAAAYRRMTAAKLLRSLPEESQTEVSLKIEKGEMNLTTLSKVQSTIRAQEKVTGKKVSLELKEEVIKKISERPIEKMGGLLAESARGSNERKSEEETQKLLFKLLPEAQSEILQDRKKIISEDLTRHSITFTKEMSEDLKRVKEVLSHICPNGTDQEVIAYALKFLLKKKDPENHKSSLKERMSVKHKLLTGPSEGATASAAEATCVKKASCTYKDPKSGKICGSRYQLQIDHIIPKALGGTDDPNNLRSLCRAHNIHAAEKIFGKKHMDRYLRKT